jgi:hypothetical protein
MQLGVKLTQGNDTDHLPELGGGAVWALCEGLVVLVQVLAGREETLEAVGLSG